jgi:hypothetical protein
MIGVAAVAACAVLAPAVAAATEGYAALEIAQPDAATGQAVPRATILAGGGGDGVTVTLDFALACPAGTQTAELFAAVADTLRVEPLPGASTSARLPFEVPLRQLAWLQPLGKACQAAAAQRRADETDMNGTRWFRIMAGTSATATLTCANDRGGTVTASAALPVTLWLGCPTSL